MLHLLRLLGLTIFACLVIPIGYAQQSTITSCVYDNQCAPGSFWVFSRVFINNCWNGSDYNLETDNGDGVKDISFFAGSGPLGIPQAWPTSTWYSAPGDYRIKHVLLRNSDGKRVDSVVNWVRVQCDALMGQLYNDANSDCIFNPSEHYISGVTTIQVDSDGVHIDTIYANRYWYYKVLATSPTPYSFKVLNAPIGYSLSCPLSGVINKMFYPDSLSAEKHFAFQCSATPSKDFQLSIFRAFRGATSTGPSYVGLYATNTSCHSGTGTVTLQISPKYNINTSGISPSPAAVSGRSVTWNISNMADGNVNVLYVPLTPLSTTNNGDTVCTYAVITPTSGDGNPANNVVSICDTARSSWDPNEKSVFPNGPTLAGTLLTYTIDFENLGGDTAFNIHVQDTLSEYLEPNSFQILSATHYVEPYVYEIASGQRVIKFDFPNINLASKSFPSKNKGQIRFTISMKQVLPRGTEVKNRAGIYFDRNPVVLTNYTYNRVPGPADVAQTSAQQDLYIFPNPANNLLNIQVTKDGWSDAILSNTLGQVIVCKKVVRGSNEMNVSALPAGIYLLQVRGIAGIVTRRIEKR